MMGNYALIDFGVASTCLPLASFESDFVSIPLRVTHSCTKDAPHPRVKDYLYPTSGLIFSQNFSGVDDRESERIDTIIQLLLPYKDILIRFSADSNNSIWMHYVASIIEEDETSDTSLVVSLSAFAMGFLSDIKASFCVLSYG